MVNAENFRTKIKEQNDKIADEISVHIQSVLSAELEKEEVKVPFYMYLNKQCSDNQDIVRAVMNTLGFKVLETENSTNGMSAKIDFSSVQNKRTSEITYNEIDDILKRNPSYGSIFGDYINDINCNKYGL